MSLAAPQAALPIWFVGLGLFALFGGFVLFGYSEARRDRQEREARGEPEP